MSDMCERAVHWTIGRHRMAYYKLLKLSFSARQIWQVLRIAGRYGGALV